MFSYFLKKPFNFFEKTEGKIYMKLNYHNFTLNTSIQILDGNYKDKKMTEISLVLFKNDSNMYDSRYSQSIDYKKMYQYSEYSKIGLFSITFSIFNVLGPCKIIRNVPVDISIKI